MTVRLLCTQIPQFWEYIKYALSQVERFGSDEESLGAYNRIFASLLNDKSQCLIMHDDSGMQALMITEIFEDLITAKRTLNIRCLYAFNLISDDKWKTDFHVVKEVAIGNKCSKIVFQTSNARIERIANMIGFTKDSINMSMEV